LSENYKNGGYEAEVGGVIFLSWHAILRLQQPRNTSDPPDQASVANGTNPSYVIDFHFSILSSIHISLLVGRGFRTTKTAFNGGKKSAFGSVHTQHINGLL